MKKNYRLMALSILFMLTGCLDSTSETKFSVQGIGVDDYIKDATVCIDANNNRVCDDGETSTKTDEKGGFSFSELSFKDDYAVFLLVGGIDISTNKPFEGEYKRIFEKSDFGTSEKIVLNSLTDLVATSFLNLSDDNRTLSKTKEDVATQFAINVSEINKDPMQDISLFTKIQTAEQLKNILSLSISKYLSKGQETISMRDIIHNVAKSYAYEIGQNPNQSLEPILAKMFIALEANYKIEIPVDEKAFLVSQLLEIIKVILEVQNSTDINISQLPKVQNGLELLLNSAYYAIEKDEIPAKGIVLSLATMIAASDADDIKILEYLASDIYDRSTIEETYGAKVTYAPVEKKVATALEQVYPVTVSMVKRGKVLNTHFTEIIEADEALKNTEDLDLVTSIAGKITSRDLNNIDLSTASVEFSKEKIAIDIAKTYSVLGTVTKGSQKATATFNELIDASRESLTANQIAVISIANQLENRTLPSDLEGTTISFEPTEKKSSNAMNQSYTVLVTIVKGDANTTTSFIEGVDYDVVQYNAALAETNLADINAILTVISGRVLPSFTNGVTITFDPSHSKRPTREEQTYDVKVIVSKGKESKFKVFSETISTITTYEEDNATVTNLKDSITSRDLSQIEIDGAIITYVPEYRITKEESYNSDVTVTITKGAATTKKTFSETIPASNVYVSFSGGGWHSHTTLAGWLMGAMDAMDSEISSTGNLLNLTKNVDALSCNSGGCWFATQLTFSEEFASRLETQSNEEYLGSDGYLGQTKDIFKNDLNHLPLSDNQYIRLLTYTSHWSNFMRESSFKPFDMITSDLKNTTLDSPHLDWADTMPLIYSSSLNTNTFVTSDDGWWDYKTYYQAGIAGEEEWFNGIPYSLAAFRGTQTYTPVCLTSLGNSGAKSSPVFLEGDIKLRYAYDNSSYPWINSSTTISKRHPSGSIKVFDAASSSSAAPGIAANINYELSESAIGFEVTDNGFVHYLDDGKMDEAYADTADKRRVRFSDGGYVDNSSVAFMMKHLQENNIADNFKIVLFMNSSSTETSSLQVNKLQIPQSAAILFGKGQSTSVRQDGTIDFYAGPKTVISVPSADIFTAESWNSGKVYWERDVNGTILQYVRFNVETKYNPKFGITSGDKGELHLFIGTMNKSNAMPGEGIGKGIDNILGTYEVMLKETRKGVTEENGSWKYLKEALNL